MGRPKLTRSHRSAVLAAALLCLVAGGVEAVAAVSNATTPADLFARAETTKIADHEQFLHILAQLQQQGNQLSRAQKWHLRYLDAWRDAFEGKLNKARPILDDIIDHSDNVALKTRASALLINIFSRGNRYVKAYALANNLMTSLPNIKNAQARAEALREIVQLLAWAGQYDQALQYIRQLKANHIPGTSKCTSNSYAENARFNAGKLSLNSPDLRKTINLCLADKEIVYANTLRLDMASLLLKKDRTTQALALLRRIGPSIRKTGFQPHVAQRLATMAWAYLQLGDDSDAIRSAHAALATSRHSKFPWPSQIAYQVLYRVETKAGHDAAALSYYQKYVALHDASINDIKARALAYQMVKQEVLAKKLKLEALTRQNRILQLRQALAKKAAETSRLYIALLIIAIVLIAMWLYRLKHSQLRFRRMARHDDLTETFNRQHFLDETKRVLQRLAKAEAKACLVIMDLDHFKRVNDIYGHIAGDDVLKHAVEISRRELRASDVFGRLGGEEFGILMPACSSEQGAEIGERIRHALASTPIKPNTGELVTVSASFGLACSDTSGYELVQLLVDADAALYMAKRSGRNRLVVGTVKDEKRRAQGVATASRPVRE